MNSPVFSVIIPTFNRSRWLQEAIHSVLQQSYQDFEIIVVDDGSSDDTLKVVSTIRDGRIRYLSQSNQGSARARNAGLCMAKGKYITFLDDDDYLLPTCLASHLSRWDYFPEAGMLAGGYLILDQEGHKMAERRPWQWHSQTDVLSRFMGLPLIVNAVAIKREWLERVGGFRNDMRKAEDLDLWLRLAIAGCPLEWTPEVVCTYRMHSRQSIRDGLRQHAYTINMLDRLFAAEHLPQEVITYRKRIYSAHYLMGAFRQYATGEVAAAKETMAQAIELDPSIVEGRFPPLAYGIICWAADPLIRNPAPFVTKVLNNLPDQASPITDLGAQLILMASLQAALDAVNVDNLPLAQEYMQNGWTEYAQVEGPPIDITRLVVDSVRTWPAHEQVEIARKLLDCLPMPMHRKISREKVLGRVYMAEGFASYEAGQVRRAGGLLLRGIWHEPAWAGNRGVWAILGRSFIAHLRR